MYQFKKPNMQIFNQLPYPGLHLLINVLSYCVILSGVLVNAYHVEIKGPDSVLIGSTANFTAFLYDDGKIAATDAYRYVWKDNANPKHYGEFPSSQPINSWSIEYPINQTKYGKYQINLIVQKDYIIWISIASSGKNIVVTDTLTGKMQLIQNGDVRKKQYVSTKTIVNHDIDLPNEERHYIMKNATYVQTYWFQNCTYLGITDGLNYQALYSEPEEFYEIEALVVVSFEKLPDPVTTTTTSTTTTTTTTTSATPKTTTPTTTSTTTTIPTTSKPAIKTKRDTSSVGKEIAKTADANAALLGLNLTLALQQQNKNNMSSSLNVSSILVNPKLGTNVKHYNLRQPSATNFNKEPSFNCIDKSIIARDPMKIYGYYKRLIVSKSPISNFTSSGKNWLQHGDILSLNIKCKGSSKIKYCALVFNAPYNATGNETCRYYTEIDECEFNYSRYFSISKTVLFFIRNDVSETVNQVTINIYEAKKQSQLSVVVVPVSFTLIAIILVVFGVSYYLQSRNRFNVEVADFNFGETQSVDLEYKTFHQRLIDSVRDAVPTRRPFSRSSSDLGPESDSPAISNDSNLHYNTMN